MKIAWTQPAVADLENIRHYVEISSERAAMRVVLGVMRAAQRLEPTPFIGRPGRVPGTRELVVTPYIVAYRVVAGVVEVLRVLHTSRRWPSSL